MYLRYFCSTSTTATINISIASGGASQLPTGDTLPLTTRLTLSRIVDCCLAAVFSRAWGFSNRLESQKDFKKAPMKEYF